MRNKVRVVFLMIALMSCNKRETKNSSFFDSPLWIEHLIEKYDCKEEYDFAKLLVNTSSYQETCISVFCPPYNYDQKVKIERMNQFRIELDTIDREGIVASGDTLTFFFKLVNKDGCYCADRLSHYPGFITLIRGTKEIVWLNIGSASIQPIREDIDRWLNDSIMLSYVRQNQDSVDPWFYEQLVKRGYLK